MKRCWILLSLVATPAFADEATETPTKRSGRFEVGAGYNSDDGFVAHSVVAQDNLFGTGQHLSLHTDLSAIRQQFSLAHEVALGDELDLRSELFAADRTYPDFKRRAVGGQATLTKRIGAFRAYARYRVERVEIDRELALAARSAPIADGNGMLATLGGGLEYNTLDQPFYPLHGTQLHVWFERAGRGWGSDYDLDRRGVELHHARPLGPLALRIRGRASQVRMRDGSAVPLAHRLFHDGHAEVRGFALDQSTRLGDTTEASGSVELELPLVKKWGLGLVGFHDIGWRDNLEGALGRDGALIQRSIGAGIIWRTPIGPVRIDYALPLDDKTAKPQWVFGFGGHF